MWRAAGRGIFPGLSVLDNLRFSAKANPGRSMDVEEIRPSIRA